MFSAIRRKFVAGIIVTVPAIVTYLALRFLFNTVDDILGPLLGKVLGRDIPGLGLVATALLILIMGFTATNLVGRRIVRGWEGIVANLPVVRRIYISAKEFLEALTSPNRMLFREVVLVEYPRKGIYSYAFVTSYVMLQGPKGPGEIAHVFVSNPPVPTTGTFIAVPVEELMYLDMPVDTALKLIVSGGIVTPAEVVPMSAQEARRR
ncbi:MAG TPA: DUF502 domain-containing protein, partial [bacterium]|nr:DUF502 domain-containing protein [bacterium]